MSLGKASRGTSPAPKLGDLRFELSTRATGLASSSGRTQLPLIRGSLVVHSASFHRPGAGSRRVKEPLTVGGLACIAKATLGHGSRKAQLKALGTNTRRALLSLPENAQRLVAGAFAGAISKTATAPIETVRMQMMTGKGSFGHVVRTTWAEGGVLGFFSGNSADVLRTMPSKAIELASFDLYKRLLTPSGQQKGPGGIATSVAGGLAGMTSTVAMFPLETARTRLAVNHRRYKNMFDCLASMAKTEGVASWYKGLDASLIGVIPYAAVRLGMYDGLKWTHARVTGSSQIPAQNSMLYGALAAVTSATVSFPLEVVRRRMMMGTAQGSTLTAVASIARNEGIGSLYKGVLLTWAKQAPQYAVTFCCYDLAKSWLSSEREREGGKGNAPIAAS